MRKSGERSPRLQRGGLELRYAKMSVCVLL
jgi:hypothetical protein